MIDLFVPDLSERPHSARVSRAMRAKPEAIYKSFTTGWEDWFALPGGLIANAAPQGQLFFVVEHEGKRHPHYGRFLTLEPDRKVELTWLTGQGGTQGAETILSIEIVAGDEGCTITLSHRGFYNQERADAHGKSWEQILTHLDARLTA
jgi:uncharacterized protein YndB with AHSA1/START domain